MALIDATAFSLPTDKAAYLAALEDAIFRGVDYVSYNGDQVKYRSLADMLVIEDRLRADLGMPVAGRAKPKRRNSRIVFGCRGRW